MSQLLAEIKRNLLKEQGLILSIDFKNTSFASILLITDYNDQNMVYIK